MKYKLNLVRNLQQEQRDIHARRVKRTSVIAFCIGALVLSVFYAVIQVLPMQESVREEKARLKRIKME